MRSWVIALACLLVAAAPAGPGRAGVRVGDLVLRHCGPLGALCGRLPRPLDPAGRVAGEIGIGFRFYPHANRAAPALGTIVATEGGPGYATTTARGAYLDLFTPLLDERDLLLMDDRGTGTSQPIDCKELQSMRGETVAAVGACGRSLGTRADYFGTPLAADDLAAVLDALRIGRIDLYGDSYGTFFGQVFAARHPERLRSLVLDGAYPVIGEDPFYGAAGAAVRRDFDLACQRAPTCRDLPGTSLGRITRLLDALRAHPVSFRAHSVDGLPLDVTADAAAIGNILYDGTSGGLNYRELDPAARAYLDNNDAAPLLRLIAENIRSEGDALPAGPPDFYSRGLFVAASCMDYPQIYDMTVPPEQRRVQAEAAIAAKAASDPGVYAPITLTEWLRLPLDLSELDLCLDWPVAAPPYKPGQPIQAGTGFPDVPTLVISGELDALTTPEEAAMVARQFPRARHIVVANSFHVDAVDDLDDCAAGIVQRFVATLDAGAAECAARIRPLRLPPGFFRHAADVPPAESLPGDASTPRDRALAAACVQTAGDALARRWVSGGGEGVGLRGGRFALDRPEGGLRVSLRAVRWTEDMAVSGTLDWDQESGEIAGHLTFSGPERSRGSVDVRWNDRATEARALLAGAVDGRALAAAMPAP